MSEPAAPPRIDGTLAILCGAGRLPLDVAKAAQASGIDVFLIGVGGEADVAIEQFPHAFVGMGQVGRLLNLLKSHDCRDVVIVGRVARPRLKDLKFDLGALRLLPRIVAMLRGGDNHLLGRVAGLMNEQGIRVHGAHEVAPDILAGAGNLTSSRPSDLDRKDAALGMRVIEALAPFDIGQAVVVEHGRVIAMEAAEGTDAMLRRVADLRRGVRERAGVLVKRSKPGQDLRVDMAAVGTQTIDALQAANLAGLAIEAGRTLMVDADEMVRRAEAAGLFIVSLTAGND